jgi:membrane-associated phospholipid phosphatase
MTNTSHDKKIWFTPPAICLLLLAVVTFACGPASAGGTDPGHRFATSASLNDQTDADTVGPSERKPRVEFILSPGYAKNIGRDLLHTVAAPAFWNGKDWTALTVRTLAVVGTVTFLDRPVKDLSQNVRGDFTNHVADRFDRFGLNYPSWVFGGFYLGGWVTGSSTAKEVGLDGFAAMLISSNIITPFLKRAFGRLRPYRNSGTLNLKPFTGHDSFPSGHATRAFTMASVIASHYDRKWIKWTAYGIAGLVAFSRVNYNVHWASDVLAGAFIGIAVGQTVVKINHRVRMAASVDPSPESTGAGLSLGFPLD